MVAANEMRRILASRTFIDRASTLHNNKYNYSKVEYLTCKQSIILGCPIHGEFLQSPNDHLSGNGCPKCKFDKLKVITSERINTDISKRTHTFIEKAIKRHGSTYIYENICYKNAFSPINITCKIHGPFPQLPINHLAGSGCSICGLEKLPGGYSEISFRINPILKEQIATFYVVKMEENKVPFIKIGVTVQNLNCRLSRVKSQGIIFSVLFQQIMSLYKAFCLEQAIKEQMKSYRYFPTTKFAGNTECFKYICYDELLQLVKQL